MIYNCFDKSATTHSGTSINTDFDSEKQQLSNELNKPIFRKFKKRRIY